MRRRRALCSNFRRGARKADVELEGRQSDSHAAGAKNVRVCVAEERPIAFRYKTQRLRSGCPCLHTAGLRPVLMRMPFALWNVLAGVAEILPHPPLTRNQVELMQIDTTASDNLPGFRVLGILVAIARRRTRSDAQAKQMRKLSKNCDRIWLQANESTP